MRISRRLAASELYPLTAGLLGNIDLVLEGTEGEFPELRSSDRTFVIMTEWRKRLEENPSADNMVRVFEEMKINKHKVCMVGTLSFWYIALTQGSTTVNYGTLILVP